MRVETYTRDDLRDLITDAVADSIDMDWKPGEGAEAVMRSLDAAGLFVLPDFAKLAALAGATQVCLLFHAHERTRGAGDWTALLMRGRNAFTASGHPGDEPADVLAAVVERAAPAEQVAA